MDAKKETAMWPEERIRKALELKQIQLKNTKERLETSRMWTQSGAFTDNKDFTIACERETCRIESDVEKLSIQIEVLMAILDIQ